jgi:hypothetical protein
MWRELENALYAALVLEALLGPLEKLVPGALADQGLIYLALVVLSFRKLRFAWLAGGRHRASVVLLSLRLLFAAPPPSAVVLRPRPVV